MRYNDLAAELVGMARLHAELGADASAATKSTARELDVAHAAGIADERARRSTCGKCGHDAHECGLCAHRHNVDPCWCGQDDVDKMVSEMYQRAKARGAAEERERWTKAIAKEREEWSPSRHVAAGGAVAALRAVLIRMGIAP